jgi:hypothetical protein
MISLKNLSSFDKDLLISWFNNRMRQSDRRDLMLEFPALYNRLCDREIVEVYKTAETMGIGTTTVMDGITYNPGDTVPAHKLEKY